MLIHSLHWFPSELFSNLFLAVCIAIFLLDYFVPRVVSRNGVRMRGSVQDRHSLMLIQVASGLAVLTTIASRYLGWMVLPAGPQWLGLAIMSAGIGFREWAIIVLGRSFSRAVRVEAGQRLVAGGPYRWIRHPAYTGMLLVYIGFGLALGSLPGTLAGIVLMGLATLYRIKVEEAALMITLGAQYEEYASQRWMIFPGW